MKKPTAAGLNVLDSFKARPTDELSFKTLKMWQIQNRSGTRSVNVYRVVEKLEADGFLASYYGFDGTRWSLTEAGTAALSTDRGERGLS